MFGMLYCMTAYDVRMLTSIMVVSNRSRSMEKIKYIRACLFPTQCLKTDLFQDQKPDPHYFLGSLGIRWSAYKKQTCGPEKGLFLKK